MKDEAFDDCRNIIENREIYRKERIFIQNFKFHSNAKLTSKTSKKLLLQYFLFRIWMPGNTDSTLILSAIQEPSFILNTIDKEPSDQILQGVPFKTRLSYHKFKSTTGGL